MTQPANPAHGTNSGAHSGTDSEAAEPTSPAHLRQRNAQRAAYAAQALQLHTHISGSTTKADNVEQALIELLTDLHHLCHTCDLDLTPSSTPPTSSTPKRHKPLSSVPLRRTAPPRRPRPGRRKTSTTSGHFFALTMTHFFELADQESGSSFMVEDW